MSPDQAVLTAHCVPATPPGAADALRALDAAGLRRRIRQTRRTAGRVRTDGRPCIDFSSNDYLGLASDPRPAGAAARALAENGLGAGAARLISGNHAMHDRLEAAVAAAAGAEATLLFGSGYLANVGAIPALAGSGDVLYCDALNHASLIDGCRLSRAERRIYPHLEMDALEDLLRRSEASAFRRRWIVTESLFSMDGDLAPLDRLVELAERYDASIYLDEAHTFGIAGEGGGGAARAAGVDARIAVRIFTLGKALGASGAVIAGSADLREWLLHAARSFVFTTASPPALAAGAIEALRVTEEEPARRTRLLRNARRLREGLRARGRPAPGPDDGYIVPILIGDARTTVAVGETLLHRGFLVGAIRPPTVPDGTARLRVTVSAAHTADDIASLLGALDDTLPPLGR